MMSNAGSIPSMPNPNDRIMAALSHASIILPFWGIIASIVIWVTQRDKSPFVAFQALQALAYHLTAMVAGFVGMVCYMCSFLAMFLFIPLVASTADPNSAELPPVFAFGFFAPFLVFGAIFLGYFAFAAYGLFGAVSTLQRKDFRYAVLGARLKSFLQK